MTDETQEKEPDIYAAQREELMGRLKKCLAANEPFTVLERPRLTPDDIAVILQKLKNGYGFSRKERSALTEAGFHLEKLFPNL